MKEKKIRRPGNLNRELEIRENIAKALGAMFIVLGITFVILLNVAWPGAGTYATDPATYYEIYGRAPTFSNPRGAMLLTLAFAGLFCLVGYLSLGMLNEGFRERMAMGGLARKEYRLLMSRWGRFLSKRGVLTRAKRGELEEEELEILEEEFFDEDLLDEESGF